MARGYRWKRLCLRVLGKENLVECFALFDYQSAFPDW